MREKRHRVVRPYVDALDERTLLSASVGPTSALSPAQVAHAYGLDSISFNANGQTIRGDGSGQTIALIDAYHDPELASDLHTFDQAFGLSDPALDQIDLARGHTNDGWAGEEAMDAEWAHALAPGASIVVVEARSDNTPDLLAAVAVARNLPSVSVISMSWGGSEIPNETNLDATFTTPAGHQGITFIASAGDAGANGGAQWPAASPNVIGVGGTTLNVDSAGDYLGESVWIDSSDGFSFYESAPSYQASFQPTSERSTPDVEFDADPQTGVLTYATTPSNGQGSWQVSGGTSVGAPAWSALIAIADQGRVLKGLGTLDGPTQTLPGLYSLPSTDFHAISPAVTGFGGTQVGFPVGNLGGHGPGLGFFRREQTAAVPAVGDVQTGLGSPDGGPLIHDLVDSIAQTPGTAVVSTPTAALKKHVRTRPHRTPPKPKHHPRHVAHAHAPTAT